jgi:hypothetical protein
MLQLNSKYNYAVSDCVRHGITTFHIESIGSFYRFLADAHYWTREIGLGENDQPKTLSIYRFL